MAIGSEVLNFPGQLKTLDEELRRGAARRGMGAGVMLRFLSPTQVGSLALQVMYEFYNSFNCTNAQYCGN